MEPLSWWGEIRDGALSWGGEIRDGASIMVG